MTRHFVTAFQKVGTFQVVNGRKQGGNVASYFCLPNGTVVHAVPGPVDAGTFLREARFAVEVHKLAATEAGDDPGAYRWAVRAAHHDRLKDEQGVALPLAALGGLRADPAVTDRPLRLKQVRNQGVLTQASALLAAYPLARLEALYPVVWEQVLNEKLSPTPVAVR